MSRLQCLGKSLSPQKQLITSAHDETHKPSDKVGGKTVTDKHRRSPPTQLRPHSVQETQKSVFPRGDVLSTDDCSPKESPRVEEHAQLTPVPDGELKIKDLREVEPSDSALTGGTTHSTQPAEPLPTHELNEEEEQTEDKDIKAPVELMMEFLRAVMDRDFQLASKLCQMILIYEPDNPEASEFLPLIKKKISEEKEAEQSTEEDEEEEEEEDDDDDDDSGSNEESSQSSSSSPSDEEKEEKQVNRHKPCPPSHISP